jgi:DNA helicase-2/ATP-dependent DNA helicase PcrA
MVIQHNRQRSDKKLWTAHQGGSPVKILGARNQMHEGELLVDHIQTAVSIGARRYADFAVLYRANAQSRAVEEVFLRHSLPYQIVGGTRFYDRAEIKDVLAYLKLIYQPFDRASFQRIVNVPRRGLGATSVNKFVDYVTQHDHDFITALNAPLQDLSLQPRAVKSLQDLGQKLRQLSDIAEQNSPEDLLRVLLKKIAYLEYLHDGSLQAESRVENVNELLSVAKAFNALPEFLEEVALVSSVDTASDGNAVTLMTLHAAKGLEFPVVFMVGMEEGVFPLTRANFDAAELEEERRLCYVGMTRAREELILTAASERLLYGNFQHNLPSRFLFDVDADALGAMTTLYTE